VFGGAARLLIDALRGVERQELTTGWRNRVRMSFATSIDSALSGINR